MGQHTSLEMSVQVYSFLARPSSRVEFSILQPSSLAVRQYIVQLLKNALPCPGSTTYIRHTRQASKKAHALQVMSKNIIWFPYSETNHKSNLDSDSTHTHVGLACSFASSAPTHSWYYSMLSQSLKTLMCIRNFVVINIVLNITGKARV